MQIDQKTELRIVDACRRGMTGRAAAAQFGVSASLISKWLRRHNVVTKVGRPPCCALDHSAFDTITPESAYWIGFLFADGCVGDYGRGSPSVILDIGEKDRDHLEKFRSFLRSSHAITSVTHKTDLPNESDSAARRSFAFRVRSSQLVAALRMRGLTKRCEDRLPTPDIAKSSDFWRGVVDGDGTVRVNLDKRRGYEYPNLILCGHLPLIESYSAFLARDQIACNITRTSSGIFQIRLMAAPALVTIRRLYEDASVALDRKHAAAREIMGAF